MAANLTSLSLGLFGHPVAQSYSPRIHKNFAAQCGLELDYQVFDVDLKGFADALEFFRLDGGSGCNITVPLKKRAFELAGQCSQAATDAQAVNTLEVCTDGSWQGENTDGRGLINDLRDNLGLQLNQRRICLLGAGGAANGVLGALLESNPEIVVLANRSLDKATELANRFSHKGNTAACGLSALESLDSVDIVINATSVGHEGKALKIPAGLFKPGASCYDMNYGAASIPLQRHCDELEITYIDGLGMLLEQAACAFECWTGIRPSTKDFSW